MATLDDWTPARLLATELTNAMRELDEVKQALHDSGQTLVGMPAIRHIHREIGIDFSQVTRALPDVDIRKLGYTHEDSSFNCVHTMTWGDLKLCDQQPEIENTVADNLNLNGLSPAQLMGIRVSVGMRKVLSFIRPINDQDKNNKKGWTSDEVKNQIRDNTGIDFHAVAGDCKLFVPVPPPSHTGSCCWPWCCGCTC